MTTHLNVENVELGMAVGYGRYSSSFHGGLTCTGTSTVAKINGFGHITLENGMQFDKHGYERGREFGKLHLIPIAYLEHTLAKDAEQRTINHKFRELVVAIEGCRTGGGDQHASPELIAQLEQVLACCKSGKWAD